MMFGLSSSAQAAMPPVPTDGVGESYAGLMQPFLFKFPYLCDSMRCGGSRESFEVGDGQVIELTKMNGDRVTVNSDLILFVETGPETTITLANGDRMKVREGIELLRELVLSFKREVFAGAVLTREEGAES